MEDIIKNINHRIFSNPVYFIFGFSWTLLHWRFFVVMFLVSNENIISNYGITKDIYLKHILFDTSCWWWSLLIIALPFFITWIILYIIQPEVLPTLLQQHKDYEDKRLSIEKGLEIKKKVVLDLTEKNIKKEEELEKLNPESKWLREFLEFRNHFISKNFEYIIQSIYEHGGNISVKDHRYDPPKINFQIPKDILVYCHTNNLIELNENKTKLEWTNKGLFFAKEFSGDKGLPS